MPQPAPTEGHLGWLLLVPPEPSTPHLPVSLRISSNLPEVCCDAVLDRDSLDLRVEHAARAEAAQPETNVGAAANNGTRNKMLGAGYVGLDRVAIVWACPKAVEERPWFAAAACPPTFPLKT